MRKNTLIVGGIILAILLFIIISSIISRRGLAPSYKQAPTDLPNTLPSTAAPLIGGDKDENGCLIGAGYEWCELKTKCIRVWEEKCE